MRWLVSIAVCWAALVGLAEIGPLAWQAYEGATRPEVAAIRSHRVQTSATVVEPLIDGLGGDPALSYRYTVSGQTYEGFDVGNGKTGDVLRFKPGDQVAIIYASTMPSVSCLVGSMDCPNDVFDMEGLAYEFWAILILGSVLGGGSIGFALLARKRVRRHQGPADPRLT